MLYFSFRTCYNMFESARKVEFGDGCSYLRHKHKLLILSRLSDFMTCSRRFNI